MKRAILIILFAIVALSVVLGVACAQQAEPAPGSKVVRAEIQDILSRPEYNRSFKQGRGVLEIIADYLLPKLGDFFKWMLEHLGFGGAGQTLSRVLAWIVIGLFVLVLGIVIARLSARFRVGAAKLEDESEVFELPSSTKLMAEADALAKQGDFRGAFLRAYLGSIARLDEAEALRFSRSRTNWEYLRDLRDRGMNEVAQELRPLTQSFDRKFYGHQTCRVQDYDLAVATYQQIEQRLAA